MCGIAGYYGAPAARPQERPALLRRMIGAVAHRGPDDNGIHLDETVGLAHARLSIIDLASGHQPMANDDGNVWIRLQRRDLQLCRAARRARRRRAALPHRFGH